MSERRDYWILHVLPGEYSALQEHIAYWREHSPETNCGEILRRVLPFLASTPKYAEIRVVVRRDVSVIPTMWRRVERLIAPNEVIREEPPL